MEVCNEAALVELESLLISLVEMCWSSPHHLLRLYRYLYQKLVILGASRFIGPETQLFSILFDPDHCVLFNNEIDPQDYSFYLSFFREILSSNRYGLKLSSFVQHCFCRFSLCYCHLLSRILKYADQQGDPLTFPEMTLRSFLRKHEPFCREKRYYFKMLPYFARSTLVYDFCKTIPSDAYQAVCLFRCAVEGNDSCYVQTVLGRNALLSSSEILGLVDENDSHVISILYCVSILVLQFPQFIPQDCFLFVAEFLRRIGGDVSVILCFLEDSVEILEVVLNVCKLLEQDVGSLSPEKRRIVHFFQVLEKECAKMEKNHVFEFSLLPVIRRLRSAIQKSRCFLVC